MSVEGGHALAFKVDFGTSSAEDVRRLLLEQIDRAREGLLGEGASERAVHEARKACKRARATIALIRAGLSSDERRALDRAFRDAARLIGPVRDADVMRKTLAALGSPSEEDAHEVEDRQARGEATVQALDHARRLVLGQDLSGVTHDTLVTGLLASWRAARVGWDEADVDHEPEAFHEWRKAVKRLLYHVQLLHDLDPDVLGGLESQLDILQESLGDHHDLHVLAASDAPTDESVRQSLLDRSAALEARTLALGGWVLAAPPRQLRRWLLLASQA